MTAKGFHRNSHECRVKLHVTAQILRAKARGILCPELCSRLFCPRKWVPRLPKTHFAPMSRRPSGFRRVPELSVWHRLGPSGDFPLLNALATYLAELCGGFLGWTNTQTGIPPGLIHMGVPIPIRDPVRTETEHDAASGLGSPRTKRCSNPPKRGR